jgi:hypothetical protein
MLRFGKYYIAAEKVAALIPTDDPNQTQVVFTDGTDIVVEAQIDVLSSRIEEDKGDHFREPTPPDSVQ